MEDRLEAVRVIGLTPERELEEGATPRSGHDSPPTGKVLILLAADRVTGPAKGLFQLLHHARGTGWTFLLGLFHLREAGPISECAQLADRLAIPYVVLEQTRRFDLALVWRMRRVVREHGVTLLQSHSYKGHLVALLLRRLTGLPWLAFAHGWTDEDRRIRLYNRLDLRLLRYANRVVAVSRSVRQRLESAGVSASHITVVPNAVELHGGDSAEHAAAWRNTLGIPRDTPVLSVIGRLSREKGQDTFLEACRLLADRNGEFVGILVGEGPFEAELRAKAQALRLGSRVRFAGHCDDVAAVYAASDAIVIPSRSEGLPNVLLEAMAHGKAVIATRVGGIPEVLSDGINGRMVLPEDPLGLGDTMATLLADAGARAALGERARADVHRFSPEARAHSILSIYTSTVRPIR